MEPQRITRLGRISVIFLFLILISLFSNTKIKAANPELSTWAQWNVGYGISVNRIVVDPLDPRIVYAATKYGVFKRGTNGTWIEDRTGINSINVLDLAVDPCTAKIYITGGDSNAIWWSPRVPGGTENWQVFASWLVGSTHGIASYCGTIVVGLDQGLAGTSIQRAIGGSNPFVAVQTGVFNYIRLVFDPFYPDHNIAYAGNEGEGIYKSINDGASWGLINNNLPVPPLFQHRWIDDIDFHAGTVWIVANIGDYHGIYMKSTGDNWLPIYGQPSRTASSLAFDEWGYMYLGTDDRGGSGPLQGVVMSTDGGISFSPFNSGFNDLPANLNIHDLAYAGGILYAANDAGVWQYAVGIPLRVYVPTLSNNP